MSKFDPLPDARAYYYQFERALDAWDWLDENGFEETAPNVFRKHSWDAQLHRDAKDRGELSVHVLVIRR